VFDLVFSLIDRVIQLVEHHQKMQQDMFKTFVDPIFSDFELVNKQYLDSFKKYKEMIRSSDTLDVNHPIFDIVEEEILMTSAQRTKLEKLANFSDDSVFGDFIGSIHQYLAGSIEIGESLVGYDEIVDTPNSQLGNIARSSFLLGLGRITLSSNSQQAKQLMALKILDYLIKELRLYRKCYASVSLNTDLTIYAAPLYRTTEFARN
jgi:hypothetical protein